MLSTDGRWKLTPRLHSVKFVFDAPTPADAQTPDEIVFENPFPTDVPGIPKRFVFRSPVTKGSKEEYLDIQTTQNNSEDSLNGESQPDEPLLDAKSAITGARTTTSRLSHIRGPVCELAGDIKSAVCAAWALMLSSQSDSEDIRYGLYVTTPKNLELSNPSSPVKLSINRQQQVSEFLRCFAETPAVYGAPNSESDLISLTTDEVSLQTIIAFSSNALEVHQSSVASNWSIRLECSIDDQELEVSATYDEQYFSRTAVRLLLNDLEHVLWQLDDFSNEQRTLKNIQTLSPASQRHLVKLNRP
ncbi:uncharacterized protein ColSpa_04885 [Colletotrichum spaethianum]|uniref:Condensation domain-containing protein n=1 Tax=Colletotrichum spaethianum TaxID=700344 RepID=A0AA37P7M6_9PEZI|nr:uncharacterized protein ColSpa_04885 [Colletotrichum spaethianum]GKT44704.1 hypothetical protein ColSpa_04885 [Colletotrichum spaethianum]